MRAIVRGPMGANFITALPPFIALGGRKLQITEMLHKIGMLYDSRFGRFSVSWLCYYLTLKDLGIKLIRSCLRKFKWSCEGDQPKGTQLSGYQAVDQGMVTDR